MNTVICGLDAASTSAQVCLLGSDGKILFQAKLSTGRQSEEQLLAKLPAGSVILMESTGRYHLPWARRLAASAHAVYVLNPLLAKRLGTAKNALRQNKTDKIDARQLAEIGRRELADLSSYLFTEEPARLRLRTLCQVRKDQRMALTNLVKSAQHLLGLILPEATFLNLAYNKSLAELFLSIRSLEHLRGLRRATIERHACTHAEALIALLKQPLSAATIFDALLPALQAQLRAVQSLRALLLELDAAVRDAVTALPQSADAALARTIPGYGPKTVPPILACMPAGWRDWGAKEKIARKLQAYFGFDPKLKESGDWKGVVRMSKRGVELARTALFQVAVCSLLHDPDMKATYDRKRAEGKHHLVAISHVMRKQLRRLVAVLVARKPFVPLPAPIPAAP